MLTMTTTMEKQSIYYVTPEEHERLRRLSFEKRVSMAQLIRYALEKVYFDSGSEQKQGKEGR